MSRAQQIARLRHATGMGVLQSRIFLLGNSPELIDRIIRARETQSERLLHDPIEDEGKFSAAISEADREVGRLLKDKPRKLGLCHLEWKHKKTILKERFGITWYSP